jgi:hypothetical protein
MFVVLLPSLAVNGCARHVVVRPDAVAARHDEAWRFRRTRAPAPPALVESSDEPVVAIDGKADGTPPASPSDAVTPLRPAEVRPPPPAIPPEVLASPRDGYGIPQQLYAHDPALGSYLEVMRSRVSSHRAAGAAELVFAAVTAGLGAGLFYLGSEAESSSNPRDRSRAGSLYVLGTLEFGFAAGFLVCGLVDLFTSNNPSALQRYYRESYEKKPSP